MSKKSKKRFYCRTMGCGLKTAMGFLSLLALPGTALADSTKGVVLKVNDLIHLAAGVGPFVYPLVIICVILLAANAANIVLLFRSLPRRLEGIARGYLAKGNFQELRSLAETHRCSFTRSLASGLKAGDGSVSLDAKAIITAWEALTRVFFLLPGALKAYALVALSVSATVVGVELVRLYGEIYATVATVVGVTPVRHLFNLGMAKIIVIGMAGLSVFTLSLASSYLLSGLIRILLIKRTSRLVDLIAWDGQGRK